MSDGVYVSILYMNMCALMCVFVYLCVCDSNDAFLLSSIGLSARCW